MKYLTISVLWIGYCALHSFLISISFSNLMARLLKKYYAFYRLFYVVLSLILLIWLINYTDQFTDEAIVNYSLPLTIVRYILLSGAFLIFFWTFFFSYDSLHFFGIRQIMDLASSPKQSSAGDIKRNGFLGYVRHPMYLALIIFLWCQTFTLMDLVINVILTVYVIIGTLLEERKLIFEFGSAYENYQKEVPMLIPFTKKKQLSLR
ncbi:MAG: NnrU family protein [Bacteroidota bacterium]|nr:NnrU family protein [Bacteroidota bacterium]